MTTESLVWLIPFPPLLAFFVIVLFINRYQSASHWVAITGAGISWLLSMIVFLIVAGMENLSKHPILSQINWLPTQKDWLKIGVQIDPLSAVTLFFVAWTVLMIFIYSVGYHNYGQPKGDHDVPGLPPHGATVKEKREGKKKVFSIEPMYSRFFALISLFAFAMYVLVVSSNLLTLYIGWEIMGFCSYALIGFWFGKDSARKAAVKAFLTTRVGDVFMLLGLVALYTQTGSLSYQDVFNHKMLETLAGSSSGFLGLSWAGLIGLLLFIGTVGKSAQFPLHVWLPDAMEGPTPVSAMIHAATMVSAGVYLVIRIFPLLSIGWEPGHALTPPLMALTVIGTFTALFAATIALGQNDIKRVLAYSTISQLGYMIAALGIGAYVAAAFHLVTHAFFKALLFLGSGSVIHGMEHGAHHADDHHTDPQDMFNMGGLRRKMPFTFWTFLLGGLALAGFPLVTSGFWSKDEILTYAFKTGQMGVFIALAFAALLTAFYTMRQITLTFFGNPRTHLAEYAHESTKVMVIPLVILAFFAVTAGWVGIPYGFPVIGGLIPPWFEEFVGSMLGEEAHGAAAKGSLVPLFTSIIVSLGGLFLGWLTYRGVKAGQKDPIDVFSPSIYRVLKNKYYIDEIYSIIFIKPARWLADVFTSKVLDQTIIDGFLHAIANFFMWSGKILRNFFDQPVVNGAGDSLSRGIQFFGWRMRFIQSGKIQNYMILTIFIALITGALVLSFLL